MSALGSLVVSLSLEHAQFTKGLDKSSQDALRFAKQTQDSFDRAERAITGSFKRIASGGVASIAAFVGVNSFAGFITSSLKAADAINDVAKANEVAVGSVLKLSQALQLNGGESDNASKLFSSLTAKLDEAAGGSEKTQAQFKSLNISMTDLARLDGQQLFEKTLKGLGAIEDPIKRNALAMDFLGKSVKGVDIAGLATDYEINQQNFDQAEKSFKEIGEAMDRLDKFTMNASKSLAETFGATLNNMIKLLDDTVFGFDKLEEKIRKNRNQGASEFKARPTINDKPTFGTFNLPVEYQAGGLREVIDPDAAKKKTEAEKRAKEQLALYKQSQEEKARWEEKFRQENAEAYRRDYEGQAARIEKNQEERLKWEEEFNKTVDEMNRAEQQAEADRIQRNRDAEIKAQEDVAKERAQFWDDAEKAAHQVWTNIGQDGENVFKSIGRTIETYVLDLLYQMTLKKWFISIGATASGTANASTGGGADLLGTIKSAFDSGNASLVGGIKSIGDSLSAFGSTGTGMFKDLASSLGSFTSLNATMISDVLPFAGAAFSLLKGDMKGALSSALGAALTFTPLGPIGGIVGSVLGSALGGMFGGGHVSRPKYYANSTVTQDSFKSFNAYGNSDASGRNVAKSASGSIADQLQQLATSFNASLKAFTLGVTFSQKYNTFGISVGNKISKDGKNRDTSFNAKDNERQQNAIAQTFLVAVKKGFTDLPSYISDILNRSTLDTNSAISNLGILGQIKSLKESLSSLPEVFNAIGYSINNAKLSDVEGIKAQFEAVNTYTSLFYSDAEQFASYTKQISSQFGALNLAIPSTRDGFRQLIDSIKVTDDASANQFNALVALAPRMDTYYKQLSEQAGALDNVNQSLKDNIDINLFKTRSDFIRAQDYASLGMTVPSYDIGTAYVPNDGLAMIDQGERIIPASENASISQALASNVTLLDEVRRMREESQAQAIALINSSQKIEKIMTKIDKIGIVISETDNAGNRVTLDTRVVA